MKNFLIHFITLTSISILSTSVALAASSEAVKEQISEDSHMAKLIREVFEADLARGDVGAQTLVDNLNKKYVKNNHVFSALVGDNQITLVPLTDYLFSEKRFEAFDAATEFGKLTIKEWIMMVGRAKNAFESPEHEASVEQGLTLLQNQSDAVIDKKIRGLNFDTSRPTEKDFFRLAKDWKDKNKRSEEFAAELEAVKQEIRIQDAEYSDLFMKDGLDVSTTESFFPDAFIIQVGMKIPSLPPAVSEPISPLSSKTAKAMKMMVDATKFLSRWFASNSSFTLTLMARPWYKHIRNITNNNVTVSKLSNPFTYHWEYSGQLWYSKDALRKQELQFTSPRLRVGGGVLWSRDMKSITEVGGIFLGGSNTIATKSQLAKSMDPTTIASAKSLSVKYGLIAPLGNLDMSDLPGLAEHKYLMVGANFGVPLEKQSSIHGNGGYVFNLTEFLNPAALPLGEETEEEKAAREYTLETIQKLYEERQAEESEKQNP